MMLAPQDFTETTNTYRRITAGKSNHILDASPDFHGCRRKEANPARADVTGQFDAVNPLIAQMDDMQRELQAISLRASLFQLSTLIARYNLINWYRYQY